MSDATRRTFLAAAGTGAAAAAAVAAAPAASAAPHAASPDDGAGPNRLVVYVEDAATGTLSVFSGEDEFTVQDRELTRRIARAARR